MQSYAIPTAPAETTYGVPKTSEDTKQIVRAHERCFKSLNELHNALACLEARLAPALRVEPQAPQPSQPAGVPTPITIYDKLDSHAEQIECARNRVNDILRLLEM